MGLRKPNLGDADTMTRALLIILAEHVDSARALATASPFNMTDEQAAELLVPAGSPTGALPATHWWASGQFTATHWQAIQGLAMLLPWADAHEYNLTTDPDFPASRLSALNLLPIAAPQI